MRGVWRTSSHLSMPNKPHLVVNECQLPVIVLVASRKGGPWGGPQQDTAARSKNHVKLIKGPKERFENVSPRIPKH